MSYINITTGINKSQAPQLINDFNDTPYEITVKDSAQVDYEIINSIKLTGTIMYVTVKDLATGIERSAQVTRNNDCLKGIPEIKLQIVFANQSIDNQSSPTFNNIANNTFQVFVSSSEDVDLVELLQSENKLQMI